ncbi:MAG: TonB-dependent receptor [Burkholderiales bacterium]|nr:TonB-dependent receptor [Burkholderiales bacterium]
MTAMAAAASLCMNAGALAQQAAAAAPAADKSAGDKRGQIQEIVVTAQFRRESEQKTPIAITVIGGDDLGEKGIANTKNLVYEVPGLAITSATPNANLSLRGVGSGGGNAYADPTVSFNLGGVNIARQFTTSASFYDLERIEVLRGPQGTLYGRNATVGAMNVVPNAPVFKSQAAFGVDLGSYHQFNTNGMINSALSDEVAVRLAFKTEKHSGYLSNGQNDADNQAARLGVLFKPAKDLSVLFSLDYFHMGGVGPGSIFQYPNNSGQQWQNPSNPWQALLPAGCGNPVLCPTFGDTSVGAGSILPSVASRSVVGTDAYQNNQQMVSKLDITKDFGDMTLEVIPATVQTRINFNAEGQGFQQLVFDNVKQYSLETRLASNASKPLKWLVGAFLFSEKQDSTGNFLEANGYQQIRNPNLDDTSSALFGQTTYSISDALRATGGLRYTKEKKSQDGYTILDGFVCPASALAAGASVVAPNLAQPAGGCSVPNSGNLSFTSTDYKVGGEYDVAPQSLLYADVSSGFKAGGFWAGLPPNSYKPEKMTAYSIGSKNRFLDNRLQANFELFMWKYKDQQISVFTGINPAGQTARPFNSDGKITGLESDLKFQLTAADRVSLDLLLEKGTYAAFPLGTNILAQVVNNYAVDMPRLNMPRTSLTAGYEHSWDFANGANVTLGLRTHYESSATLSALAVAGQPGAVLTLPGAVRPSYHVSSINLTYAEPQGKWQVTGYVDNVENTAVITSGTAGTVSRGILYRPANTNSLYGAISPPRTMGVRLQTQF